MLSFYEFWFLAHTYSFMQVSSNMNQFAYVLLIHLRCLIATTLVTWIELMYTLSHTLFPLIVISMLRCILFREINIYFNILIEIHHQFYISEHTDSLTQSKYEGKYSVVVTSPFMMNKVFDEIQLVSRFVLCTLGYLFTSLYWQLFFLSSFSRRELYYCWTTTTSLWYVPIYFSYFSKHWVLKQLTINLFLLSHSTSILWSNAYWDILYWL